MRSKKLLTVALALLPAFAALACETDETRDAEPIPPEAKIEGDRGEFAGHHYRVVDEDVSWHEAKKRCETMGGYLACIESAEEQAFIAELADGRYLYLGGTDEDEEGEWRWVNGSTWEFTSWLPGQPNNWGGDEHYLATYDGGDWVDVAAEGDEYWMPTGFICEMPGPPKE